MSNMFRALSELGDPARSAHSPEVIVLDSESETPIKNVTTPMVPVLKKRKLDMLKEGGLEVTPIGSPGSSGSGPADGRSSVKPSPSPDTPPGQVSIMVTPDLSHMLGSPKAGSPETCASPLDPATTPTNSRTVINVQDLKNSPLLMYPGLAAGQNGRNDQPPPKVIQSRSIYANTASGGVWYGNPKDYPRPGGSSSSANNNQTPPPARSLQEALNVGPKSAPSGGSGVDVLDLRCQGDKPAVDMVRVMPSVPPPRHPPIRDSGRANIPSGATPPAVPRTTVGSNLEITLVQNPKLAIAKLQQEQRNVLLQQRRQAQQQAKSVAPLNRPASRLDNGKPHTSSSASTTNSSRSRPPSVNNATSSAGLVIPSPSYMLGNNSSSSSTNSSGSNNNSKRRNSNEPRPRGNSSTPVSSAASNPYFSGAAASLFPNLLQNLPAGSAAAGKNAFLPSLDLMYYQAYNQFYNPAAASALPMPSLPMSTPQLFMPTEEQFQFYKNILSHQLKSNPAQANEDIAKLLQDQSTSITLVGNSKTPTSK